MAKIIVIEDELSIREEVIEWLTFEEHEVFAADNGLMGLDLVITERPDLVMCDVQMPGMSGFELLKEIRALSGMENMPFVFITAATERESIRKGMNLGADDYITKPFTLQDILDCVNAQLEKHQLQQASFQQQLQAQMGDLQRPHLQSTVDAMQDVIQNYLTMERRLEAISQFELLDTPAEDAFDRITQIASQLIGAPVTLLSVVVEDRQFFKSAVGLDEPWKSARETPLSHSFCQYVVVSGQPLVVEDARTHPLVHDNLAIPDLGVIGYMGVPISSPDGDRLASLCAITSTPRQWTADELQLMQEFGELIMTELHLRSKVQKLKEVSTEQTHLMGELRKLNQQLRLLTAC